LGGYDAIAAVSADLVERLQEDPQLGRFWAHRGVDGLKRELQLLIDYLCSRAGGPVYYRGRDMLLAHRGMRISESDWNVFLDHAGATLAKFARDREGRDRRLRAESQERHRRGLSRECGRADVRTVHADLGSLAPGRRAAGTSR